MHNWDDVAQTWLDTFDEIAPGTVEGLYVVGSAALQDWQPRSSDVDIIALTAEPADDEMAATLLTAHAIHVERHPDARVDGPFLAWGDLTVAPVGVSRPWTLDGEFHHDGECFEINPVTWYTLSIYGIAVRGPRPGDLGVPLDRIERIRFVHDNAASYWSGVLASLRGAISELDSAATLPSTVPEWCLLGACRMLYTATTGDVASKSAAGLWAADETGGEVRATIKHVVSLRNIAEQPVALDVIRAAADAMADVLRRVALIKA